MYKDSDQVLDAVISSPANTGEEVPSSSILEMRGISKQFPGVLALDNVDFDLRRGEVHILFGENGAGKSTLINVIAGTFPPDKGTFRYDGKDISHLTPHRARVMGISPVFQEFSLIPNLTVEENLFLGRETSTTGFLRKKAMSARAAKVIEMLGFDLDPKKRVSSLSRAHQQMVEIAKALLADVRLLILDEPTASLTENETYKLFELIGRLKADGVGIIYVSHRMREIKEIGDRITVLRDGLKIETCNAADVGENELVELMTGRKIDVLFPKIDHKPAEKLLEINNLTLANHVVENVSIYARAGEITGIAGLVGCGKSELVRAVFGLEALEEGEIIVKGEQISHPRPDISLSKGVCYFPSDRVAEGLALERPIRENASMAALNLTDFSWMRVLKKLNERKLIQGIVDRLKLRPPNIERAVGNLSGGNRQKVMLARGLTRETDIFLFDEPTVGIDVGAKVEVYDLMKELVDNGAAIILVSSELPEVLNLSNRLYVMHRAKLVAELTGDDMTEQAVLSCFFQDEEANSKAGA
ncbi:sugar ABC transporter ATP-binding protein [Sneathiella sp. HT1-7]|uniref:sugar ABC transporter ATP-binding protein n=1 Tax=Sneathiella sp. HT1-7 TaxID=2887192 RepID=UPI001D1343C9|nr:sugar ABC transporter ATP-binding protein [Sneathiella sp. HT1-7]MCC3305143.1 sugar ABC transporter ATP-binding protein [Sneathiella sp. HT1-7]